MHGVHLACLWPGLAGLWYRGLGRSLLLAVICAWAACLLLLATWVWPEWLSRGLLRVMWFAAIVAWLFQVVVDHWQVSRWSLAVSDEDAEAFENAQREYLRGNWFDAEAILLQVVHRQPRDVEALLLLVSVLRQTHRWQAALRRLGELELLDAAARWTFEISREKQLIGREMAAKPAIAESQAEPALPAESADAPPASEEIQ